MKRSSSDSREEVIGGLKKSPDFSKIRSFEEFYPLYLKEHSNRTNRRLHFIGSSLAILMLILLLITGKLILVALIPTVGYGFAWVGHFFFEKNKPASFKKPLWSFMGDCKMYSEIFSGKIPF